MDAAWRDGTRLALRLALAHHPLCGWFSGHTVRRAGLALCLGCAVTLPAFLAGALAAVPLAAAPLPLSGAGLALGFPYLITRAVRAPRWAATAAKGIGGAGLGVAMVAFLLAPWPPAAKAVAAAGAMVGFGAILALRLRAMRRTCRACPWDADWDRCPGFAATAAARARP